MLHHRNLEHYWSRHSSNHDDCSREIVPDEIYEGAINFKIFLFKNSNPPLLLSFTESMSTPFLSLNLYSEKIKINIFFLDKGKGSLPWIKVWEINKVPEDHVSKICFVWRENIIYSKTLQLWQQIIGVLDPKPRKLHIDHLSLEKFIKYFYSLIKLPSKLTSKPWHVAW